MKKLSTRLKRYIATALTAVLLLNCVPMEAYAAGERSFDSADSVGSAQDDKEEGEAYVSNDEDDDSTVSFRAQRSEVEESYDVEEEETEGKERSFDSADSVGSAQDDNDESEVEESYDEEETEEAEIEEETEEPSAPEEAEEADEEEFEEAEEENVTEESEAEAAEDEPEAIAEEETVRDVADAATSLPASVNGVITLSEDVVLSAGWTVNDTVTLDLNDHYILYAGEDKASVITVDGGNLTMSDNAAGKTTRYVILDDNGRATEITTTKPEEGIDYRAVTGGFIAGGTGTYEYGQIISDGGGVYIKEKGVFTMNGGTIVGCAVNGFGGGVYIVGEKSNANGSTSFVMTAGKVIGCTADSGAGGVYIGKKGKFEMSGSAAITGCSSKYLDGGVECWGEFRMSGGSISGNNSQSERISGCGLYFCSYDGSSFYVQGTPVIKDNYVNGTLQNGVYVKGGNGKARNVFMGSDHPIVITDTLGENAEVCITGLKGYVVAQKQNKSAFTSDEISIFHSDDENLFIATGTVDDSPVLKFVSPWEALQAQFDAASEDADDPTVITLDRDYISDSDDKGFTIQAGKYVTLNLNDHYILYKGTGNASVIRVDSGNLTMSDNAAQKTTRYVILGDNGRATEISTTKPEEGIDYRAVTGGFIAGGSTTQSGAGVYVSRSGSFKLQSGTICGNKTNIAGGGVYTEGVFEMSGGSIYGNTAEDGGGVFVDGAGEFSMQGGVISGNNASGTYANGGGVHIYIYHYSSGKFSVSGSSVIKGNTCNGVSNNVEFLKNHETKSIIVSGALTTSGTGKAEIWVTAEKNSVVAKKGTGHNGDLTAGEAACFHSDNEELIVVQDDNKDVKFLSAWGMLQAQFDAASTNSAKPTVIELDRDYISDSDDVGFTIPNGKYVTLNLNGHYILHRGSDHIFYVEGALTMKDSASGSAKKTRYVTLEGGRATGVAETGTEGSNCLKVTGGFIAGGSTTQSGAGVYVSRSGSFKLQSGTICGNKTNIAGGGVYTEGVFEMSGGSIYGNTAEDGGGVFVDGAGEFSMQGGVISGNNASGTYANGGGVHIYIYHYSSGKFSVSGSSVIKGNTCNGVSNNVEFFKDHETKSIIVSGALTNGADIHIYSSEPGIAAQPDGVKRTAGITAAEAGYFHSDNCDLSVALEDGKVWFKKSLPALTAATNGTYNGEAFTPVLTFAGDAPLTVSTDYTLSYKKLVGETETAISGAPINAGSYRVVATGKGDYAGESSAEFTIEKATPVITQAPQAKNGLSYNGAEQVLISGGSVSGGSLVYVVTDGTVTTAPETGWGSSLPEKKNAGSYSVFYKVDGGNNYTDTTPVRIEAVIAAKPVVVSGITADNKTYDGETDATFNCSNARFNGSRITGLSVTATGAFADKNVGSRKTVTISKLTLAGTEKDNYVLAAEGQQTEAWAGITAKSITVSGITAHDKVYDRNNLAELDCSKAVFNGIVEGDKLTVSGDGIFLDANVETDKTVYISGLELDGADKANYVLAANGQQKTTKGSITPAKATVSAPEILTVLSYTGASQALAVAGYTSGGTMLYAVGTDDKTAPTTNWSMTVSKGTNAGDYYLWYRVNGEDNYEDVAAKYYGKVTIARIAYTGTVSASVIVSANAASEGASVKLPALPDGAEYAATGTAGGATAELISGTPRVTDNKLVFNTTAQDSETTATITVAVTGATNYEDYEVTVTVIARARDNADVSITGGDQKAVYGTAGLKISGNVGNAGTNSFWVWTSSDETVATIVEENGNLVLKSVGNTTITGRYESDSTVGEASVTLTVEPKSISVNWTDTELPYTGEAQKPKAEPVGVVGRDVLSAEVSVSGNAVNAGKYTATVALKGSSSANYVLDPAYAQCEFSIVKTDIADAVVTLDNALTYTGEEQTQLVKKVELGETDITEYVTVSDNKVTDAGSYQLKVTAKEDSNYSGSVSASFNVAKKEITPVVSVSGDYVYTGSAITPEYTVKDGEDELAAEEYTVSVSDNVNAGKGKITVTAAEDGNYSFETVTVEFDIARAAHEDASVSASAASGAIDAVILTELVEEGGSAAVASVSGDSAILAGYAVSENVLGFTFVDDMKNSGKCAVVYVTVSGCLNYEDYTIVVSLYVNDCTHANTVSKNAVSANCTEAGYTGDIYCADCGELLEEGTAIEALGHDFGEWFTVKEPTVFEEGLEKHVCSRCGAEEENVLDKLEATEEEEELIEDLGDTAISSNTTVSVDEAGHEVTEIVTTISGDVVEKVIITENGEVSYETKIWVVGLNTEYHFSGSAIKPEFHIYDGLTKLVEGKDYSVKITNNKNVGDTATVTITFKGNYKDTPKQVLQFKILPAVLGEDVKAADTAIVANGSKQRPVPNVFWAESGKSIDSKNFSVSYYKQDDTVSGDAAKLDGVTEAGVYTAVITAKAGSDFSGSTSVTVTVVADKTKLLSSASVKIEKIIYTGQAIIPEANKVSLTLDGQTLTYGKDYVVSEAINNVEPGKATVIFEAREGNAKGLAGTKTANFTITKGRVLNTGKEFGYEYKTSVPYAKGGAKPAVTVTDNGRVLKEGTDYSVSAKKNKSVTSDATLIIKGKGNYKGTVEFKFAVTPQNLAALSDNAIATDKVESNKGYRDPKVTVTDSDGKKLAKKDFAIDASSYAVNGVRGAASAKTGDTITVDIVGSGNYEGRTTVSYRYISADKNIGKAKAFKIAPQEFNGHEVTLSMEVMTGVIYTGSKSAPKYLVPGVDFVVESYQKNTKAGTAKVTFRGIGEYGGTKTMSFKITAKNGNWKGRV